MSESRPKLPPEARQRLNAVVDSVIGSLYPSKRALAEEAGLKPTTLQQILTGEGDIGLSLIGRLCDTLEVSVDYILTGYLPPRPDDHDVVQIRVLDLAYGLGGTFIDENAKEQIEPFPRRFISAFTKAPADKLRLVRGIGDSMMPTINDGDLVFIDLSQNIMRMNDQVWALATGEIGMVKRLRMAGGVLHAISDNPLVSDYALAEDDYRIVGRVVACVKGL